MECNQLGCRTEAASRPTATTDKIHKPAHYNQGKIEVWDFIVDQDLPYLAGNVLKYLCRYRFKGTPIEDLLKARAYLDRQIKKLETEDIIKTLNDIPYA